MKKFLVLLHIINMLIISKALSNISNDGKGQNYEYFKNLIDTILTLEEGNFTNYHMQQLPTKFMDSQPTLKKLSITMCDVIELKIDTFEGLENLETLNLSQNKIENLDDSYFSQLDKLKDLDLSSNSIVTVVAKSFNGLKSMINLNLDKNAIEEVPVGIFDNSLELRSIVLSKNKIKHISSKLFHNLQKLKMLDLSKNKIDILAEDFITNAMSLVYLGLNNNLLTRVEVPNFEARLKKTKRIRIHHNPWLCSCLNELLLWLNSNHIKYFVKDYFEGNRPICVFESELSKDLQEEENLKIDKCKRLRNAEIKMIQNAYKEAINKYNFNNTNSDSISTEV